MGKDVDALPDVCPLFFGTVLGQIFTLIVVAFAVSGSQSTSAQDRPLPLDQRKSGLAFASSDVARLQNDELANPGMLWVERGETLWKAKLGAGLQACAECHTPTNGQHALRGSAGTFPKVVTSTKGQQLLNLEAQINHCRTERQRSPAFAFVSEDLLGLTAYVAFQSRGMPLKASIDGAAKPYFERANQLYYTRIGQLNLACNQCHEQQYGKRLLAETISQGHGAGYPAYRFEWQSVGSLNRRLRACFSGVRAQMPEFGSDDLSSLELFLAWRAQGMAVETPAVRR